MIVGNIRSVAQRNRQLENQFGTLKLQSDLNQYYKQAQRKTSRQFFEPVRPVKPKDQLTTQDLIDELSSKLQKYMLNNNEVLAFLSSLQRRNMVDDMYNMFSKFEKSYLIGTSRLTSRGINDLLGSFIARELRPEQVVVGTGVLPAVKSKYLSASGRSKLIEALKKAGNDAL